MNSYEGLPIADAGNQDIPNTAEHVGQKKVVAAHPPKSGFISFRNAKPGTGDLQYGHMGGFISFTD